MCGAWKKRRKTSTLLGALRDGLYHTNRCQKLQLMCQWEDLYCPWRPRHHPEPPQRNIPQMQEQNKILTQKFHAPLNGGAQQGFFWLKHNHLYGANATLPFVVPKIKVISKIQMLLVNQSLTRVRPKHRVRLANTQLWFFQHKLPHYKLQSNSNCFIAKDTRK